MTPSTAQMELTNWLFSLGLCTSYHLPKLLTKWHPENRLTYKLKVTTDKPKKAGQMDSLNWLQNKTQTDITCNTKINLITSYATGFPLIKPHFMLLSLNCSNGGCRIASWLGYQGSWLIVSGYNTQYPLCPISISGPGNPYLLHNELSLNSLWVASGLIASSKGLNHLMTILCFSSKSKRHRFPWRQRVRRKQEVEAQWRGSTVGTGTTKRPTPQTTRVGLEEASLFYLYILYLATYKHIFSLC